MTFTDHQVRQLLGKLDRIATALERLADNHGTPTPEVETEPSAAPTWIPNTASPDFDS